MTRNTSRPNTTPSAEALRQLAQRIVACERCPRMRSHCKVIGKTKRRAWMEWDYWAKPVPGWGDPEAEIVVLGLAPGAHGANRTGRMFTGDKSGEFLYRALWETGFASQPVSEHREDDLELRNVWITAAARCAPPDNKPLPEELRNCEGYLREELTLLERAQLVVALGSIGAAAYLRLLRERGVITSRSAYVFGHGALHHFDGGCPVLCSYHPSQQNTSTGRLTREMLRAIFETAAQFTSRKRFPEAQGPATSS